VAILIKAIGDGKNLIQGRHKALQLIDHVQNPKKLILHCNDAENHIAHFSLKCVSKFINTKYMHSFNDRSKDIVHGRKIVLTKEVDVGPNFCIFVVKVVYSQ
jgi:hypothetical protein